MPTGESAQPVTVKAEVGAGQVPAVVAGVVAVNGPSSRLATVTRYAMSGARPTAPFQVKDGAKFGRAEVAVEDPGYGAEPLLAPSVVAGSPRVSVTGLGVLKMFGNWVAGLPAAMSA